MAHPQDRALTEAERTTCQPCPWCGHADTLSFETRYGAKWVAVMCGCAAGGPDVRTGYAETGWEQDAITAWNTRAAPKQET